MPRPKKTLKLKEPVRLRSKKLSNGSQSLYLDIYKDGQRQYEFLKLYILPELTPAIKEQNAATLAAANAIKSKRIIEITNNEAGLKNTSQRSKMLLLDWFDVFIGDLKNRGARGMKNYVAAQLVVKAYCEYSKNTKIKMRNVGKEFCLGFIDFMRNVYKSKQGTTLAPKSQSSYFGFLSCAMNAAVRADVIAENPCKKLSVIEKVKVPESKREFLTIDEVKKLIETDCSREDVKRAYLFSCYCGLRLSDVYGLRWKDIIKDGEQWRVTLVMQKTSNPIYLPLSNQAMKWMPERGETKDDERVFHTLPNKGNVNLAIHNWAKAAGITKNVTFHTSRHTFATMMLTLGADIYTTSKLLGHSKVETTTIYAKIVNKKKDDAVNLVDSVFN